MYSSEDLAAGGLPPVYTTDFNGNWVRHSNSQMPKYFGPPSVSLEDLTRRVEKNENMLKEIKELLVQINNKS